MYILKNQRDYIWTCRKDGYGMRHKTISEALLYCRSKTKTKTITLYGYQPMIADAQFDEIEIAVNKDMERKYGPNRVEEKMKGAITLACLHLASVLRAFYEPTKCDLMVTIKIDTAAYLNDGTIKIVHEKWHVEEYEP